MIITDLDELRLCFPSHAYDSISSLVGVIDNSEHDFLQDKLGTPLYQALCDWYNDHPNDRSMVNSSFISGNQPTEISYFNRLLLMAQRMVAFDAVARAAGTNIISINNAGLNTSTSDDYGKVDLAAVDAFKSSCTKEAHASLNLMLQSLEIWTKTLENTEGEPDEELKEIVALWKKSRYYYRSTESLIPTATCLQDYVNIYDSREKFIQLLPDMLFIQEEMLAPAIGYELLSWFVHLSNKPVAEDAAAVYRILYRLRKTVAAMLVERTSVIRFTKEQKQQSHDDSVRLLQAVVSDLRSHADDIPSDVRQTSPVFQSADDTDVSQHHRGHHPATPDTTTRVHTKGEAAAWAPPLF